MRWFCPFVERWHRTRKFSEEYFLHFRGKRCFFFFAPGDSMCCWNIGDHWCMIRACVCEWNGLYSCGEGHWSLSFFLVTVPSAGWLWNLPYHVKDFAYCAMEVENWWKVFFFLNLDYGWLRGFCYLPWNNYKKKTLIELVWMSTQEYFNTMLKFRCTMYLKRDFVTPCTASLFLEK